MLYKDEQVANPHFQSLPPNSTDLPQERKQNTTNTTTTTTGLRLFLDASYMNTAFHGFTPTDLSKDNESAVVRSLWFSALSQT